MCDHLPLPLPLRPPTACPTWGLWRRRCLQRSSSGILFPTYKTRSGKGRRETTDDRDGLPCARCGSERWGASFHCKPPAWQLTATAATPLLAGLLAGLQPQGGLLTQPFETTLQAVIGCHDISARNPEADCRNHCRPNDVLTARCAVLQRQGFDINKHANLCCQNHKIRIAPPVGEPAAWSGLLHGSPH